MTFGLLGAIAIAPMFSVRWAGVIGVLLGSVSVVSGRCRVSGVHVWPPLSVRHTPPLAAATKMRSGLVWSTATPATRPLTLSPPVVLVKLLGSSWGAGPTAVQLGIWLTWFSRIVLEGTVRSSNRSSDSRGRAGRQRATG